MSKEVPTAAEIKQLMDEAAKLAEEHEAARRAADKVVNGFAAMNGIYAITEMGRMFYRSVDPRVTNDGRGGERFRWTEIEGPLA